MVEEFEDTISTKGAWESAHETEAGQPGMPAPFCTESSIRGVDGRCSVAQFNPCKTLSLQGIARWSLGRSNSKVSGTCGRGIDGAAQNDRMAVVGGNPPLKTEPFTLLHYPLHLAKGLRV